MAKSLGEPVASARELRQGEIIAQRSRRSQRGKLGLMAKSLGEPVASARELRQGGIIAQRSRRSQRGEMGLVAEGSW
jgi:hypothetical protein